MGDEIELSPEDRYRLRRAIFAALMDCPAAPLPDGWRGWEVWVEDHVLPDGPRRRVYGLSGSDVVVFERVYPGPRTEVAAYRVTGVLS